MCHVQPRVDVDEMEQGTGTHTGLHVNERVD